MKQKSGILALILVLALASAAAQTPNFSGQWKMTSWKIEPELEGAVLPDITMTIKHEGAALSVLTVFSNVPINLPAVERRYTTDGKDSVNPAQGGGTLKATARFENGTLIIEGEDETIRATVTGDQEPQIEYTRVRSREEISLSADGKTLTIVRKRDMPTGAETRTLTMTKVS